jgi:hypothetical protein
MTYTTVRMVDGVHGNTTSLGPAVTLDSKLMLGTRSLCDYESVRVNEGIQVTESQHTQERLIRSATASNNSDHASRAATDNLLGTRWELDTGLALVGVVANDGDIVARSTSESSPVTNLLLHVGNNGTLRDRSQRQDVADCQTGILSGVDELASVQSLVGDKGLGVKLELVGIAELDTGERCTSAGIVDYLLHNASDISMALSEIERTELGGSDTQAGVRLEDAASTFTLVSNLRGRQLSLALRSSLECPGWFVKSSSPKVRLPCGQGKQTLGIMTAVCQDMRGLLTTRPILPSPYEIAGEGWGAVLRDDVGRRTRRITSTLRF